ncbi:nucleotidyltransferase domain-containing protein [Candidatus Aerophobetes bacterium]|nr:nucleotidyltransferase domain-containing protein [Candidatus Aerophobetes bacterium]
MAEKRLLENLKKYFKQKENVSLAFIFGSSAKGVAGKDSDLDIAVYLKDEKQEDEIWKEVSRIAGREVDLVVLNSAPASLVSNVLKTGISLAIKDRNLFWDIYLTKTLEAEDFYEFAKSYLDIYHRSTSLIPEDKTRLIERIQFLESEFKEIDHFKNLTFEEYQQDKVKRRNMERWADNIINATIDIAKIILASEKKEMPRTYQDSLLKFGLLISLIKKEAEKFSTFARLRNILAHEYLDILYKTITNFIRDSRPLYEKIFKFLSSYI